MTRDVWWLRDVVLMVVGRRQCGRSSEQYCKKMRLAKKNDGTRGYVWVKKWPWDDSWLGPASEAKSKYTFFQLAVTGVANLELGKGSIPPQG